MAAFLPPVSPLCQQCIAPLVEALPGVLWVRALDGGAISYASGGRQQWLALDRQPLQGQAEFFQQFTDADEQPQVSRQIRQQLQSAGYFCVSYRLRHADGHWLTVEEQGIALPGSSTDPVRLCSYVSDISQRQQGEKLQARMLADTRSFNDELMTRLQQTSDQLAQLECQIERGQRHLRLALQLLERWQRSLDGDGEGLPLLQQGARQLANLLHLRQLVLWRGVPSEACWPLLVSVPEGMSPLAAHLCPTLVNAIANGLPLTFTSPNTPALGPELRQLQLASEDYGHWLLLPLSGGALLLQGGSEPFSGEEQLALVAAGQLLMLAAERQHSQQQRQQLKELAYTDELTQLENRRLFMLQLKEALCRQQRDHSELALLFLDLDGFKAVNDEYGHEAGDQLLAAVAQRLKLAVRSTDHCARMGGDEFVVLLYSVRDVHAVADVGRKVLAAFAEPFTLGLRQLQVGASIGIAMAPDDSRDLATLLRLADDAMYRAKRAGGSRYLFANSLHGSNAARSQQLLGALAEGLANEQFELYYQPQVDVDSGRIIGAEALLRWHHPERGLLTPQQFDPDLGCANIWPHFGEWVARQVWADRQALGNSPLFLSLNLSLSEISNRNQMRKLLERLLGEGELPANSLRIDITEAALRLEARRLQPLLGAFAEAGVGISLDDVGRGWLPLEWLESLPIDAIKLDGRIVRSRQRGQGVLRALCQIGRSLGKTVVAEGVEDPAWLPQLRASGCSAAQGYGLHRPMPFAELSRLVVSSH